MTGATYSVLAPFTGSAQSLRRSLSPVDPLRSENSPRAPRHQLFPRSKPFTHLPTREFLCYIPSRQHQKAIQYPGTRSGFVQ